MDTDEIERARRVHKGVNDRLKTGPILLAKPPHQISHPLRFPSNIAGNYEVVPFFRDEQGKPLLVPVAPLTDDEANEVKTIVTEWQKGGDHQLLQRLLKVGVFPWEYQFKHQVPDSPPLLSQALSVARDRGYVVPEAYLAGHAPSYGETEAWVAAQEIVRGHTPRIWRRCTSGWSPTFHTWQQVRQKVYLEGQFVVPDPLLPAKTPYVLDQLWAVATDALSSPTGTGLAPRPRVRLIALEVDGEGHLDPDRQERDRRRDVMLAAMGYEMFHVAGWWCRIDPFRAVCEFLASAEILPDATTDLTGASITNIDEYRCFLCGQPMVRWEDDWIEEVQTSDGNCLVHRTCCAERAEVLFEYKEDPDA
jgi:hypothetical protein